MSLPPGSRIGAYDVIALIGKGGMGEVYRARDTRLARDIAIKVLPDLVSTDRERGERFEREARALATLSHPNIAVIHGLEEVPAAVPDQAPVTALIMELVEGETLEDRLMHGPLPLDDALAIAEQIANALEAAHEKGIIHRDLKPANVKITPGGVVKVLDFGLAKIVADAAPGQTVTMASTGINVVLGTPAYMAPEQAQGRPVDKRADVWAFGALVYEMLAGERPFRGDSVQDTLAAVLTTDPDWDRIPPKVRPLLRRCLERDPRLRLRDVGDFRFLIDLASESDPSAVRSSRLWPLALASTVAAVAVALAAWGWLRPRAEVPRDFVRVTDATMLPTDVNVTRGPGLSSSVAVSPDGRTLIVAGTGKDGQRLYRRPLDRLEATPLQGTERGSSPFFSWDGAWVGFFADGRLKRVPAAGGAAVDIAAAPGAPAGASWGLDGRIVFTYGVDGLLHVVNAHGGKAEPLSGMGLGYRPEALPDGRTVLFDSDGWVQAFDRQTGRKTRLVQGTAPRYAAGQLILSRGTALMAAALDMSRPDRIGAVVPLVDGVAGDASPGGGMRHYAVSSSGTLAYVPAADAYALVLVKPDGTERVVTEGHRSIENPQFSPDGRHVVVATARGADESPDLWIHELQTGTTTARRMTLDGGRAPVWTPDGTTVTYSHLGERQGIYSKRVDGGDATQLLALDAFHWLVGWTPDRRTLAYGRIEGAQGSIMAFSGDRSSRVVGPGSTWGGRLSHDGRWLAYYLLESGNFEVYVTPFPEGGTRWLIAEGTDPTWGPDDAEVYYRSGTRLMAARIDTTSSIRVLSHRLVIEPFLPPLYDDYDINSKDGTLVMVRPAGATRAREVSMVIGWLEELRRSARTP
jgi:serine/threonine-protein kinase